MISGARIPFNQAPPLILPTSDNLSKFQTPVSEKMTLEIRKMIQERVLEPAPSTPSFICPLFMITKSNGKTRVIFNLKALNLYMEPKHFHLFHHQQMPSFLQQGDWMVKLDLSQAYYHLSIRTEHRRFLRISYGGQLLQMTCLPFGLAAAPRMFATITNWTAEYLRTKGLRLVVYLDDYLLVHQNKEVLSTHLNIAVRFLSSLGWCVNHEKSITRPTRSIEYLGIEWDTQTNRKSLPPEKVRKIRQTLSTRLTAGSWTLKQAQRLLGLLNFASFITHRGRMHCRALQCHIKVLRQNPLGAVQLTQDVRQELEWWMENVGQKTAIHTDVLPTNFVITDASDILWGALVNNNKVQGAWQPDQKKWHCNLKEMYAVIAVLSKESRALRDSRIILQTDNKTVVSYIQKEGGTKSHRLMELTRELLTLIDDLNVILIPHHLPGVYNTEADHLSRNRAGSEWHLQVAATSKIFQTWGKPDIDLFASQTAHVVINYVSLDSSDSNACYHDAFSRYWRYDLAWVFPPPALLPRVLHHLNSASGRYIIVAPKWKKPFWRPDLKNRSLARPLKIRDLKKTLVDTVTGQPPAHVKDLQLEAWLILAGTL